MASLKRKAPASTENTVKKARSITSFFTPKPSPSGSSSNAPSSRFDKAAWISSLTPEQKKLLTLEIETMHESWLAALKDELVSDGFLRLKRFLENEKGTVYPPRNEIYSWSRYCPLNTVKVVILGQDPYHGSNQAHGLSFSVKHPIHAPPSLVNMYKCLQNDYPSFTPPPNRGGSLVPWAERGVLMLNAALTVRGGDPASHSGRGWERLTGKVIEVVAQRRKSGVVFMAWGAHAEKRVSEVDKGRHLVLKSVHPSPLSARRGFFDCGHFKKANEWLALRYGDNGPIDWSLHGNKPVGVGKAAAGVKKDQEKKDQGKEKGKIAAAEVLPAAEVVDEFNTDDEEAMVEAAIQAEKEFTSSQPQPVDTEAPPNSKPPPTEMETIDEKKEDPANKEDKQENDEKDKREDKESKDAETVVSKEQTEEGDEASGKADVETKE
ncbi:uracil-DNA glycosylase-like protein [Trichophaea hybrida]|nr:uracil-DNA glycosylase-like protein [Trichophaea hybrida]